MKQIVTTSTMNGMAQVQVHPSEPKVRVTIKPVTTDGEEGEAKTFVIEKENCPDYVRSGKFFASVSGDGKKLYSLRPAQGQFHMKVKEFPAQRGTDGTPKEPAPKTKEGKFGVYQTFSVSFVITEGECKGMVVPGNYPYNFIEVQEEVPSVGLKAVVGLKKKKDSKYSDQLVELLEVTNMLSKQIPWKENVLPLLQKYMLKEDAVFSGIVKKGWVDSLFSDS